MPKSVAPCKDCPDRFVGCHSNCEKYKEFLKANEEVRKKRYDSYFYDNYAIKRSISLSKYRQQHKM